MEVCEEVREEAHEKVKKLKSRVRDADRLVAGLRGGSGVGHLFNHCVGELRCSGLAADIAGQLLFVPVDPL